LAEDQTGDAAGDGQDKVFGHQLAEEPPAARAECPAPRHLGPALDAARVSVNTYTPETCRTQDSGFRMSDSG
jgi:hypothetical protein